MNKSVFNFDTAALTLVCLAMLGVYALTREPSLLVMVGGAVGAIGGIATGNHRAAPPSTTVEGDVTITKP